MSSFVLALVMLALLSLAGLGIDYGVLGVARQTTLSAAGEAVQAASRQLSEPAAMTAARQAVSVVTAHACAATTTTMTGSFTPGSKIVVDVSCRMQSLFLVGADTLHASEAGIVASTQDVTGS